MTLNRIIVFFILILVSLPCHAVMIIRGTESEVTCTGDVAFLWECTSVDVSEDFCSAGDYTTTNGGNGDVGITDGICWFVDTYTHNDSDYYSFTVDSGDIITDTAGTVFIKVNITTLATAPKLLVFAPSSGTNSLAIDIQGGNDVRIYYNGNGNIVSATTDSNDFAEDTDFIIRARWRQGTNGSDPSVEITLFSSAMSQLDTATAVTALTAMTTNSGALYIGNYGGTADNNIEMDYIHIFTDWRDDDVTVP